jgi:hypothetical protein
MGKHSSRHVTPTPGDKPPTPAVSPVLNSPTPVASEPPPESTAPQGGIPLALLIWCGGFLFLFLMMLFDLLFGLLHG